MSGEAVSVETPFAAAGPEPEEIHDGEEEGLFEDTLEEQEGIEESEESAPEDDPPADEEESEDADGEEETDQEPDDETEAVRGEVEALTAEGDAASALLAKHGIDYAALRDQYKETGELSVENITALEKAGFTRDLIQGYIEGQQSRYYTGYVLPVKNAAGGEKAYDELCDWAAANLSEKEQNRFNKAVESNDIDLALTAVENLVGRREKAVGTKPEIVQGRTAKPAPGVHGFASLEEMAKAVDDPRYEVDMNYTKKVERRMLASDF